MDQPETSLKPNVLVAPLDWGLGHATRCIPVIKLLIRQNCRVFLAGEGKTKTLLENEFPQLEFLDLKGYRIRYSENKRTFPFALALQIPKLIFAIKKEQEWLKKAVQHYAIDAVISDNRYGLYHQSIRCIFITHQLQIKTPFKFFDRYLRQLNYKYINQFTECWIPDVNNEINFAGQLSHPSKLPSIPVNYIGLLSRFTITESRKAKHILILLSGPEPQRTILENLLTEQLKNHPDSVVFVRGLPGGKEHLNFPQNVSVYNHLPSNELELKIAEASFVIGRCGYSTVMDLAALKKKSILIATPGQTEQEYLSAHLMKNNFALCIEQSKFNLEAALELAKSFNYQLPDLQKQTDLESVVKHALFL